MKDNLNDSMWNEYPAESKQYDSFREFLGMQILNLITIVIAGFFLLAVARMLGAF